MTPPHDWEGTIGFTDTPEGRARSLSEIWKGGGPVYGTDPKYPGPIVEYHRDGSFSLGKMIDRRFVADSARPVPEC